MSPLALLRLHRSSDCIRQLQPVGPQQSIHRCPRHPLIKTENIKMVKDQYHWQLTTSLIDQIFVKMISAQAKVLHVLLDHLLLLVLLSSHLPESLITTHHVSLLNLLLLLNVKRIN